MKIRIPCTEYIGYISTESIKYMDFVKCANVLECNIHIFLGFHIILIQILGLNQQFTIIYVFISF